VQNAYAQRTPENPEIGPEWKRVEGDKPSYFNASTLMSCPAILSDGYRIVSAVTFNQSRDVSCGYRSGDDNVISFYLYPKVATPKDEINQSSRVLLARSAPGITPTEGQRDWIFATGTVKAETLELVDSDGYGQSFAIGDVGNARLKLRETWRGDRTISHRVADSFFAQQTAALTNAQNCAALPEWPNGQRARLPRKPMEAAMGASIVLGVIGIAGEEATPDAAATPPTPPPPQRCVMGSLGSSSSGASLILTRTGPQGVSIDLSDQPDGDVLAGLADTTLGGVLKAGNDSEFVLYARDGKKTAIFRTYKTLPNWAQILADMVSVATKELDPLIVIEPKEGEDGGIAMNINSEAIDAEKAKRRPGSR
jgi:hypothetical protein